MRNTSIKTILLFTGFLGMLYMGSSFAASDLEIYGSFLDTHTNSGSLLTYDVNYFNNGDIDEEGVSVSVTLPPYLSLLESSVNYAAVTGYNRLFGTPGDPCFVDLLQETGAYMLMPAATLAAYFRSNSATADAFNTSPYNGETAMAGDFAGYFIKYYGNGDFPYTYGSFRKGIKALYGVDIRNFPECGEKMAYTYTWDIGTIGAQIGGTVSLLLQNIGGTPAEEYSLGTIDADGGIITLPADKNTVNGPLSFTWTNTSENGTTSIFLNQHGGPILYNNDTILNSIIDDEMTEKEKAVAIWQFVKDYTEAYPSIYHGEEFPRDQTRMIDDYTNPVITINTLYGLCGEINGALLGVLTLAGFETRMFSIGGHMIIEVRLDGQGSWGMFDADGGVYRDDPIDGHIYSIDEIAANPNIISDDPKDNNYDTEDYIDMIVSTGDNVRAGLNTNFDTGATMRLYMYPKDTVEYAYSFLAAGFTDNNGQRNDGTVTITRDLTPYHNVTTGEDTFTYSDTLPFLIKNVEISIDDQYADIANVYSTIGNLSETDLGNLHKRIGVKINTGTRNDNYYTYSFRFVCKTACNVEDIVNAITVRTIAKFNSTPLPYTGVLDMTIIEPDDNFESMTGLASYYKVNTYIKTEINTGTLGEIDMINNTHTIPFTLLEENDRIILPKSAYNAFIKNAFIAKGYIEDSEYALFSGDALFGSTTMDFYNTLEIATDIILSSENNDIQANISSGTELSFSGGACTDDLLGAPVLQDSSFASGAFQTGNVIDVFKIGSPCTGTTITFSDDVTIKIALENTGNIQIKSSEDGESRTDLGTGIAENGILTFTTNHFSFFALADSPATEDNQGNNPSGPQGQNPGPIKDVCPNGDLSPSFYDSICIGTGQTQTSSDSHACTAYSNELNGAYGFARDNGITTINDCRQADLEGKLLRSHMAKMISNFAINVLKKIPDTTKNCTFTDMGDQSVEMQNYAKIACQLGLMGLKSDGTEDTTFNPNQFVDRGQFGTILSRLLRGDKNNNGDLYYIKHLNALKEEGIMTEIENPAMKEMRGRVMLMMQRTAEKE